MRLIHLIGVIAGGLVCFSASATAQWPAHRDPAVPREATGAVRQGAPPPRTADGRVDFSGTWMRANSGPPRGGGAGRQGAAGAGPQSGGQQSAAGAAPPAAAGSGQTAPATAAAGAGIGAGGRGGVSLEPSTAPFPYDPSGPPVATFFEAGANMDGGLPYTPWAAALRTERLALNARDNPDAMCLPMGFLQFHQQPQPRKIVQTPTLILIEYEANYGIRHVYMDGRTLPTPGDVQPWWYGYSVGRWDGDTLVVETNNLRGAEDGISDGWLDVNGSPYSQQATFVERFRRSTFDHLQIDMTVTDPKAYTRPFTVRVDQRLLPDQELIEFVCNENQQFRRKIKID